MTTKKFEFTGDTKTVAGTTLRRIRAIASFAHVKAGEIGGWIEHAGNLEEVGDAWVSGDACVSGNAWVSGNARVSGDAWVSGNARVSGGAMVSGDAMVYGDACVSGDARVEKDGDVLWFKNTWSSGRWFTYTRSNGKWAVGCFYGTGEELIKKAYADSETSGKCYEAIVRAVETIETAMSGQEADDGK